MAKTWSGKVSVDIRDSEPDWGPFLQPTAPEGSPNVLMIVWDDVGYGALEPFGGPIEVPTMRRIADSGVRFSNFHTTALCSPTRSSLLNGRNATSNNMACITEGSAGFPGFSARIPFENAMISEVLNAQGWNTYAIGKWHLTPADECDASAWRGRWPLGRGFERFYGFMGGETDQWYPELVYDNHPVEAPATPEQGYHLSKDLADKTMEFIRDSTQAAPDKPWFTYLCPGAGHAPHHVFKEWSDKYAGMFDMGYERYREIVLENQKKLGIVPADTELSPINPYLDVKGPNGQPWPLQDTVRPWDGLSDEEKRLFARMAEVFAGFLSYTDAQIGRVLDYLEESGQLDNTIIVVISDNGASGEGGPNGSVNEAKFFNGYIDTVEDSMRFFDELGLPSTFNHYPIGWAMAFNTPYKLYKRYASHEGGIADTAIVSWPNGIAAHGEVRDNYVNVADITPTVYDLLGIDPPETVKGIGQKPLDGVSFKAALEDSTADTGKDTQYYTMLGTRGIWHKGWFANTVHAASPSGWSNFDKDRWELFNIENDRSQCHDLAAEHPDKLAELQALWFAEAEKYNGLPLADLNVFEMLGRTRPSVSGDRTSYTYYPNTASVSVGACVNITGRSFSVLVETTIDSPEVRGVLLKQGAGHGGYVLFVEDGRLQFVYNFFGELEQRVVAPDPLPLGDHVLGVAYARTGTVEGSHTPLGDVTLYVDGAAVATLAGVKAHPLMFGLAGGGVDVGRNLGQPVSAAYAAPFAFTGGRIAKAVVDVSGAPYIDLERQLAAAFAKD